VGRPTAGAAGDGGGEGGGGEGGGEGAASTRSSTRGTGGDAGGHWCDGEREGARGLSGKQLSALREALLLLLGVAWEETRPDEGDSGASLCTHTHTPCRVNHPQWGAWRGGECEGSRGLVEGRVGEGASEIILLPLWGGAWLGFGKPLQG
jgi:hypothetical protein